MNIIEFDKLVEKRRKEMGTGRWSNRENHRSITTLHEFANIAQDDEVINAMRGGRDFAATVADLKAFLVSQRMQVKDELASAARKDKKKTQEFWDWKLAWIEEIIGVAQEANWLYEKFGEGEYRDVPGLCKVADRSEIEGKGWSLMPGAYVGVEAIKDDSVDFAARMAEIHRELSSSSYEITWWSACFLWKVDECVELVLQRVF